MEFRQLNNTKNLTRYVQRAGGISSILVIVIAILFITDAVTCTAISEYRSDAYTEFKIARMFVSDRLTESEPIDGTKVFSSDLEKVYCFVEARDVTRDTSLTFVWYYGEKVVARVPLPLRKGMKWRTFSSKRLAGLKGDWRVEVIDSYGTILRGVKFIVE